jgi:hypothetical protein
MKKFIILLVVVLSSSTISQTYNDFAREIFFGRLPSARTEAMGRILTVNFDHYFVSQSNPANLASTNGIALFYSNSSPFYAYNNATYNFAGVLYNTQKYGAIAFNFLNFSSGTTIIFDPSSGGTFTLPFEEKRFLYTFTYAYKIPDWFSFGVNANLFIADFGAIETFTSSFFELGLSRNFKIVQNSRVKDEIIIGTQLKNIFNQSFTAVDQAQSDVFPMIFRLGISNSIEYTDENVYEKSYLICFTLGFEYQDLFNSNKRTAYKAGAELSVIDLILLRGGYYHETTFSSIEELNEFTYGFGLKLDFDRHFTKDFPLVLLIDFVSLRQPTYSTIFDNWDNYKTFTLIANYRLN